jgi:hypothetical protein
MGPQQAELARLVARTVQLVQRVESNVAAIIDATRVDDRARADLPPDLANVESRFVERLELSPVKEVP